MTKRPLRILLWATMATTVSVAYNNPTEASLNHDACSTNAQCLNGGVCSMVDGDQGSFRHCHCPSGFGGFRCENYCPLSCQNSGVCQHKGDSNHIESYIHDTNKDHYTCKCKGYFTGKLCQTAYANCGGHQCVNGGSCSTRSSGQPCVCPDGYDGELCQIKVVGLTLKEEKLHSATIGMGSVLIVMLIVLVTVVVRKSIRRGRGRRRLHYDNEEHQNLRINAVPREETADWECRNII